MASPRPAYAKFEGWCAQTSAEGTLCARPERIVAFVHTAEEEVVLGRYKVEDEARDNFCRM